MFGMREDDPVTQAALALIGEITKAGGQQRWDDWREAAQRGVFTDIHEERDDAQGTYRLVTSDGRAVVTVNLDAVL
jgi:hypothetical protein